MDKRLPLPMTHDGLVKNLPDGASTMWYELGHSCPHNEKHSIVGSTYRMSCYQCGIFWTRRGYNAPPRYPEDAHA